MGFAFSSDYSLKASLPELFEQMEELFAKEEAVAVAVSGGSDSMVLAFVMEAFWREKKRSPDQLFFLHCNHKMRKASDDEQKALQALFKERNFAMFERSNDGEVSEEALRERRYEQFRLFMQEKGIFRLVMGHHLGDRVESTMLNLLRGCGLKGFLAMKSVQKHHLLEEREVVRPLLHFSKEKIKKLADDLGISYFEDQSNDDPSVSRRNLVRNQFLKPLSELSLGNGDEKSFWTSRRGVYQELEQEKSLGDHFLQVMKLNPYRGASQAFEWKLPRGLLSEKVLSDCFSALGIVVKSGEIGEIVERLRESQEGMKQVHGWWLFISHQRRYFIKSSKEFWLKELDLEKEVHEIGIQTFGLFQLEVGKELLGAKLRFARADDVFQGKTLKKRMLNQKIPIFWRNALPLAEKGGKIIVVWRPEMLIF